MCGDLDLTGYRKPQSYYRDILWNGGNRVYATVRFPEPEGRKIIAVAWSVYPTMPSWSWPGQEGKELQVEVYSGAEKVRLFLNDKLIGEQPTGRDQEFKATFSVPYLPGTLKAVGVGGDRAVAESVLTTAASAVHDIRKVRQADALRRGRQKQRRDGGNEVFDGECGIGTHGRTGNVRKHDGIVASAVGLHVTAGRALVHADGQNLSFLVVEAVDARGRWQPQAGQEVQFSIS